jgi:hypothetical protein
MTGSLSRECTIHKAAILELSASLTLALAEIFRLPDPNLILAAVSSLAIGNENDAGSIALPFVTSLTRIETQGSYGIGVAAAVATEAGPGSASGGVPNPAVAIRHQVASTRMHFILFPL